jgi:hypothetical protein
MTASNRSELPDISTIPADLSAPELAVLEPGPGIRTRQTTRDWIGTSVYHTLYLPVNWAPEKKYPVVVEYAGNCYEDETGDRNSGTVEDSHLGYGLSAGVDYIWICLPFVQVSGKLKGNTVTWWGDPDETVRYGEATVRDICRRFGGDESRIVLCGFSRGAIACNYIGLRHDGIAKLWSGFICHSHYDGIRCWPYADCDAASARARLGRLRGRPQFISMEGSTEETRCYLAQSGVQAPFTFVDFPFRNHTDRWALRDCELRRRARAWLREVAPPSEVPAGIGHP